jgi:hypothetical protein
VAEEDLGDAMVCVVLARLHVWLVSCLVVLIGPCSGHGDADSARKLKAIQLSDNVQILNDKNETSHHEWSP